MIKVNLLIESDILSALNEQISQLPAITRGAVSRVYRRYRARIIKDLAAYPGPVKRPIRWKSERQRKAFFASNGFGHGIPYQRTGNLGKSWKVSTSVKKDVGAFVVENTSNYVQYVQGDYQQPFHLDTGWKAAAPIIVKYETLIGEALIEEWITLVDERAGIR